MENNNKQALWAIAVNNIAQRLIFSLHPLRLCGEK
jgi:hypothetical protein